MPRATLIVGMLFVLSFRLFAQTSQSPTGSPSTGLQRLLSAELARFPGTAGVYVKQLSTGEEASIRADESFNSASVIKLPILALAMQQIDAGTLSLSTRLTITAADRRGGTGILRTFDAGLQPTLGDVLAQMVITSDNTATDLAIAQVGGVARVNAWIDANGGGMKLLYTVADVFKQSATSGYTANPRAAVTSDRTYWLGEVTPRAVGRFLERLQRCSDGAPPSAPPSAIALPSPLASKASCVAMLGMMRQQLAGARRIPHYLDVPVAHKTGDWPPYLANDVGIVYTKSGPVVISFCANGITGSYGEAEDRIGEIARLVVNYFDGGR